MATQKLILPINKMRVTAGYKNSNYQQQFGFRHYGTDLTSTNSDRTVWGSGVGTVLLAGYDNVLGNVLVIRYDNCQLTTGATKNLIQRIFHLDRIDVKQGQSITKDTRIGLYGNTGKYTTGPHLHVEFDTDTSYPSYSPTISTSSNIIKAGTDSTVRPAEVMYVKNSAPDYQTVVGASNSNCWTKGDVMYPKYSESAPDGDVGASYYPKPNYIGTSLVGALDAIGVDSSFDNREKIAKANGITDYTGTAIQNDSLFSLLMSGQLRRPGSVATSYYPVPNYTGTSLVGALDAIGIDSSFDNREKIAKANGIIDYAGTADQNNKMLSLLMSGRLICPDNTEGGGDSDGGGTGDTYYPIPNYTGTSLVGALNAIGVDSSFDNREKIAAANGITDYAGTADQNNKLLNLLMSGKLKRVGSSGGGNPGVLYFPTPSYTGTSLVGALNAIGVDSSFDNREKIAAANGITDYAGTADQNNKLLNLLMSGRLIRPASAGEDGSGDSGTGSSGIDGVPNLKVREILPPESKYSIKCPYPMDPTYITVHNTYNQASAYNEITFMHNNDEVSYHFAVDDQEAIQGLPLNRNGWHSGDGGQGTGNRKSIAVEICYSKYGGEKFDKAEKNAAKLIASLMDKFNIPIDRIRKHQDWSGKYCPHRTLDAGWDRFVDMIMTEVRYQQILKFASENGLFEGYDVDFKGFNHKEKLFEIPGTIPWRPHVIVYGEVSLVPKITNIFDVKKVLDLALTPEQMADELLDITLTQEKVEVNISREGLVLTLSNMNLGALNCDEITLTFNLDNGVFNIIAEVAETKVFENLETTVYQQLTITVHPDIQQPGLLHVPIRNTEPLKDTAEENVDYITTTAKRHRAASAVTYALIFASCLAGAAGGGWVPATVLTAFALIVKSDK